MLLFSNYSLNLGNQAASSTAGHWNEQDFTYLMIKAVIRLGLDPNIDWNVCFV